MAGEGLHFGLEFFWSDVHVFNFDVEVLSGRKGIVLGGDLVGILTLESSLNVIPCLPIKILGDSITFLILHTVATPHANQFSAGLLRLHLLV